MPNVLAVCPAPLPDHVKYAGGAIYTHDEISDRWQQMWPEGQYVITWWKVHGKIVVGSMGWDGGDPANIPWADMIRNVEKMKPVEWGDLPSNLGGNNGPVPELEQPAPVAETGNSEAAPSGGVDADASGTALAGDQEWGGGQGETEIT